MGRVTRAAARADPILADETTAVAEIALNEDPENVELPASPAKVSERPPLGEIRGNDQASVAAAAPVELAEQQDAADNADVSSQDSGTSDGENRVVLVLGADGHAKAKEKKQTKGQDTGTAKKSLKKTKASATSKPSPQVVEQLRQTLKENTKSFKGHPSKKGGKKGGSKKKVLDDEEAVSQSDASSEAAEMLTDKTSPTQTISFAENGEAAPSPAVLETRLQLGKAAATQEIPSVAIETDAKRSLEIAAVSGTHYAHPVEKNAPNAVQKLAMLFQPEPDATEKVKGCSTFGTVVSGQVETHHTAATGGIEALDALEEDIEAVEESLPAVAKTQSVAPLANIKASEMPASSKKPSPADAEYATCPLGTKARKTLSQTISPTDFARAGKKRGIGALNTPQKLKKSDKPPTISKFQLSSEATAAKLKAQREERQKRREEEEKKKQSTLKAKPAVGRAKPIEVRPTATSRARMSLVAMKSKEGEANVNANAKSAGRVLTGGVPKATANMRRPSTLAARPSVTASRLHVQTAAPTPKPVPKKTVASKTVPKSPRLSTLARSSRPSGFSPEKNTAVDPAAHTPRPGINKATVKRISLKPELGHAANVRKSILGRESTKRTSTVKGKEVFNREKVEQEERNRALKEKMDAATKARLEAAERGRAASKAWAEKKKQSSEASKSRSTSGASNSVQEGDIKQVATGNGSTVADKLQPLKEESSGGMAYEILQNGEISQDDAAYIVAEMERINEVRQGTAGQGIAVQL